MRISDWSSDVCSSDLRTAITPNMVRLAQHGVRFDLAYANQAVCAPSRINLMSGARPTSSGIYNFGMNLRDYMPDAVTLPQYFMHACYPKLGRAPSRERG